MLPDHEREIFTIIYIRSLHQARDGVGGALASECPEVVATLEAHGINGEACLVFLEHPQTRCRRAFGGASWMEARAREAGQRWFQGLGFCREIFVERPEAGDADT